MINVGCSHFSNNNFFLLSCDLISCDAILVLHLVAVQAIYNFTPRLRGIYVVMLSSVTDVNSDLQNIVSESVLQTNYSKF